MNKVMPSILTFVATKHHDEVIAVIRICVSVRQTRASTQFYPLFSAQPPRIRDCALCWLLTEERERFVLARELLLKPGYVVEKAFACKAKKVESKLRVLKI